MYISVLVYFKTSLETPIDVSEFINKMLGSLR